MNKELSTMNHATKIRLVNYSFIRLFAYLFIGLFAYSCIATSAFAQTALLRSITIVPPSISLSLNPRDKSEGTLKVINDSDEVLTFSETTQDFIVEDTKGTPVIIPPGTLDNKYSGASWIAIYPNSFSIAPHQKQLLNYFVQVPSTARPGGHYAAVVYNPTQTVGVKGTGAAVQTQIGTLFSLVVSGPVDTSALVSRFSANSLQEFGPVNILTQIRNMGDIHVKPTGTITITDMLGRKLAALPLDEHNIFPQAARDYVNIFGDTWMFGRFKATLLASYGPANNLPLVASMYFWVIPWRLTLVALLALVAIILGVILFRKRKHDQEKIQQMNNEVSSEKTESSNI